MNTRYFLFILLILASFSAKANPPVDEGKAIFSARCASCHNLTKDLTGPALSGIHERRTMEWILAFVKSSQTLVKSGDKEAIAIFEKFNKIPMPDHPDLTDDNIKNVVEYIKAEGGNATATAKAPFAKPSKLRPSYLPLSTNDYGVMIGYLAVVGLLIAALLMAVQIKQYERKTNGTEVD